MRLPRPRPAGVGGSLSVDPLVPPRGVRCRGAGKNAGRVTIRNRSRQRLPLPYHGAPCNNRVSAFCRLLWRMYPAIRPSSSLRSVQPSPFATPRQVAHSRSELTTILASVHCEGVGGALEADHLQEG